MSIKSVFIDVSVAIIGLSVSILSLSVFDKTTTSETSSEDFIAV